MTVVVVGLFDKRPILGIQGLVGQDLWRMLIID